MSPPPTSATPTLPPVGVADSDRAFALTSPDVGANAGHVPGGDGHGEGPDPSGTAGVGNGAARPAGLADGSPGGVEPARALRIVALDLSLTATGYAMNTGHGVIEAPSVKRDSDLAAHWRRLREQRNRIRRVTGSADVVAIEGPAFSKGADPSAHERAGLWWTVVDHLLLNAIPVVVISPTGLKRYATGKGNASKAEVVAAAIRRLRYGGHDDNVADAMWLFQMAAAYYGQPHVEVPAPHRSALTAVAWPDLAMSA